MSEFRIIIRNDKKEKRHSYMSELDTDINLISFGESKEECLEELKKQIDNLIYNLEEIDWENV